MNPNLMLALCITVSILQNSFEKLNSIVEDNSLKMCLSTIVRRSIELKAPLTYVSTDDDYFPIPKQYEKKYSIVNIDTSPELSHPRVATLYTSNPFDEENQCGKTPNLITSHKCVNTFRFLKYKDFNNCSIGFVSYFIRNNNEHLLSVISEYILTQLENSFNTSVVFHNDYSNMNTLRNFMVIMSLCNLSTTDEDDMDKVMIFTDDLVWITPIFKKWITVLENFFDYVTWIMIVLVFVSTSVAWWSITAMTTNNWSWTQMCVSVLNVWCLTLCGCIKTPPSLIRLKLIFIIYLFCVIIIQSAFKGNLIKALTIIEYDDQIKTITDVVNSNLPLTTLEMIGTTFFQDDIPEDVLYTKVRNKLVYNDFGLDDVNLYRNCNHLTFMNNFEEYSSNKKTIVNYFVENSVTGTFELSIALEKYHFFTESLQRLTQILIESGVYSKVILDFYNEYYSSNDYAIEEENEEMIKLIVLTVDHLYGTFVLWGIGIIVSITVFVVEKISVRSCLY
ncbi:hypothetical protein FQR65_LT08025 [Abscondita terminalis]|nr:hypothetical protein FQR65_LT08025 [Abscondita terminalis]